MGCMSSRQQEADGATYRVSKNRAVTQALHVLGPGGLIASDPSRGVEPMYLVGGARAQHSDRPKRYIQVEQVGGAMDRSQI
jgi:hypothetical protein